MPQLRDPYATSGVGNRDRGSGEFVSGPDLVGLAMVTDYNVYFDWPEESISPEDQNPGWEVVDDRGTPTPVDSCDGFVNGEG